VFAFILDSLGSTELFFILVVALIFFGPRKLPQLAKSMGKGLAEFRKASDDFKRTWEREVALEASRIDTTENSILADESQATYPTETVDQPLYAPADTHHVVARAPLRDGILLRLRAGPLLVEIAEDEDLDVGEAGEVFQVGITDHPGADEADTDRP